MFKFLKKKEPVIKPNLYLFGLDTGIEMWEMTLAQKMYFTLLEINGKEFFLKSKQFNCFNTNEGKVITFLNQYFNLE